MDFVFVDLWRNLDSAFGFGPNGCGFKMQLYA